MSSDLENKLSFGKHLKMLAGLAELKVADIAKATGVSRSAVYQWLSDITLPEPDKIDALSELFQVELAHGLPDEKDELRRFLLKRKGIDPNAEQSHTGDVTESVTFQAFTYLPCIKYSELEIYTKNGLTDNWQGNLTGVRDDLVSFVNWGSQQYPVVIVVQGEYQPLALRDGDELLCTYLDRVLWQYLDAVYILLYKSGMVQCRRIVGADLSTLSIQGGDGIITMVKKDDVDFMWTVHYSLNPRLIS